MASTLPMIVGLLLIGVIGYFTWQHYHEIDAEYSSNDDGEPLNVSGAKTLRHITPSYSECSNLPAKCKNVNKIYRSCYWNSNANMGCYCSKFTNDPNPTHISGVTCVEAYQFDAAECKQLKTKCPKHKFYFMQNQCLQQVGNLWKVKQENNCNEF